MTGVPGAAGGAAVVAEVGAADVAVSGAADEPPEPPAQEATPTSAAAVTSPAIAPLLRLCRPRPRMPSTGELYLPRGSGTASGTDDAGQPGTPSSPVPSGTLAA